MNLRLPALAVATAAALSFSAPVMARDTIQIAGSSTVLPFTSVVAEQFGRTFPQFRTPVVGSGGTGGGMRQFCQGVGVGTIDIVNASRPIRPAEVEACRANGVTNIIQVRIGFDGIVFASQRAGPAFALEPRHIFLAGAREVPQGGRMVPNPFTRWSQIDPALPDQEIALIIPSTAHGTREVYEERVTTPGCEALPEVRAMTDARARAAFCQATRADGRVIDIAGDYTETLARLNAQRHAVGVFGLTFFETNRDRLRVATINGVTPSTETIETGQYPVSRPLYFYIKGAHIGVIPGLQQFAEFFMSPAVSGPGSPLDRAGLIPLSTRERTQVLNTIRTRQAL